MGTYLGHWYWEVWTWMIAYNERPHCALKCNVYTHMRMDGKLYRIAHVDSGDIYTGFTIRYDMLVGDIRNELNGSIITSQ